MRKTLFYFLFCAAIFAGCQKDNNSNDNINTTTTSHSCGATDVHNPTKTYGTVKDIDANSYKTIQIGNQTWMAENLKTSRYRNGVSIPNITDNAEWANTTNGASCSYDNNVANDCPYGKLYNWYATTNTNGLCPTGWHVPSDGDWNILVGTLDLSFNPTGINSQSQIAGSKMKSAGNKYWSSPNIDATNSSGFSGLPGGRRHPNPGNVNAPIFEDIGTESCWWSTTNDQTGYYAWCRFLNQYTGDVNRFNYIPTYGFSVRCVKD